MKASRMFFAFVPICAMLLAACVPDGEAEIRGYTDRYGVSKAFLKYEAEAKNGDHSKIINLYIFLRLYSGELKKENFPFFIKYNQDFILYCVRYFGQDLREDDYSIPDLERSNRRGDNKCEKTFSKQIEAH